MARTIAILLLLAFLTAGCADDEDDGDTDTTTNTGTGTSTSTGNNTVSVSASVTITGTGAPGNTTWQKQITDDDFPDGDFTIKRGDSVNWTHAGSHPHSVTADLGLFDSSPSCSSATSSSCMQAGQHFEYQFETPGTYSYKCKVHPTTMTGTITVTD